MQSARNERKPKFEDFLFSVKKTLLLRSYARSKEFSRQAKAVYDVKSVRFQKKTLRKIDIEPADYEYYKRLLCKNKNPFLNVMLRHQVVT